MVCYIGLDISSAAGTMTNFSSRGMDQKARREFDDGADALWSLYGREAKTYDEAQFESVAKDMDGVLVFVRV